MGAPSLLPFNLEQTFFGFDPKSRVTFHENIFNLLWYANGRLSWDDIYNMPIFLRNYYVKRVNKMIEEENDRIEKQKADLKKPKANNLRR